MSDQPKKPPAAIKKTAAKPGLPAKTFSIKALPVKMPLPSLPSVDKLRKLELTRGLPPATIVYGCAAGTLFALALYFLLRGHWLDGCLTLLPAALFLGYAMHFMKHGQ